MKDVKVLQLYIDNKVVNSLPSVISLDNTVPSQKNECFSNVLSILSLLAHEALLNFSVKHSRNEGQ